MKLKELRHSFESFDLLYLLDEDTLHISMQLLPSNMPAIYNQRRPNLDDTPEMQRLKLDAPAWNVGNLCHIALRHHPQTNITGQSMLHGYSTQELKYKEQIISKFEEKTEILTILQTAENHIVHHKVSHYHGEHGIELETSFFNYSSSDVQLDLITSFSLDNLSPFAVDDASETLFLHRFYGGWSKEGRRRCDSIEDLNLERSWFNGRPGSERFGSLTSYPVDRYFPFAAIEDRENHTFWGAQLAINGSWQMEVCRPDDCLTFAGGLTDCEFGAWYKIIHPEESFAAPKAFLSVSDISLEKLCNQMTSLHQKYMKLQPSSEQELPAIFNEWCTSWGHPSEAEILSIADKFYGTPVKYIVIDAGWTKTNNDYLGQGGNGDWILDKEKFPNGLLSVSRKIKKLGFDLGIWYEFEVTTRGARVYEKDYDHLHLHRSGKCIYSGNERRFWDFRKPEVIEYLKEKVLHFLRDNEIGFMKVDYNCAIGIGCDGAESLGEGLREHLDAVRNFFLLLRQEMPELVIENCASGGHRLEPSMMDITALSSGSDAHECREIPVLAANTNLLILPRQNEIWCVIDKTHNQKELTFRLTAGFLGRMCLSGDVLELCEDHWNLVKSSLDFYEKCKYVLADCDVSLYQHFASNSIRYVQGTQAVKFTGRNNEKILIVCHSFKNPHSTPIHIPLADTGCHIETSFGASDYATVNGNTLIIQPMEENEAFAILLNKGTIEKLDSQNQARFSP